MTGETNARERLEFDIIGNLLHWGVEYGKVDFLKESDFSIKSNQVVWKAIKRLSKDGLAINIHTVHDMVRQLAKKIDDDHLTAIYDSIFSKCSDIQSMSKLLRKYAIKDKFVGGGEVTMDELKDLYIEKEDCRPESLKDIIFEEINKIERNKHIEDIGYSSGFPLIDRFIGGFKKSDLIILAGRPAMGKTTLALNFIYNLAKRNIRTLYINLEMSKIHIARKIISLMANISSDAFNREFAEADVKKMFEKVASPLHDNQMPLTIVDAGKISVPDIKELQKRGAYQFIVIDQLTKIKHFSRRERYDLEIAEITFDLKALAKEFSIPILLLHQINRGADNRENKRPMLTDLRDSGAVEQDGDVIIFIHRDSYYSYDAADKMATIRIAKNKMGKTGDIGFCFEPQYSRFSELEVVKNDQVAKV